MNIAREYRGSLCSVSGRRALLPSLRPDPVTVVASALQRVLVDNRKRVLGMTPVESDLSGAARPGSSVSRLVHRVIAGNNSLSLALCDVPATPRPCPGARQSIAARIGR